MSSKILCVDDDANILAGFQRNLRKQFALDIALGPDEGLAHLASNGPYAVIVADMQMPGMNGVQFLTKAREMAPDSIPIMLTGNADQKTAMDAVNQGHVFRFLTKPCPPETLALTLAAGLKQHRLITAERDLLKNTLNGAVKVLADVLAAVDPASFGLGEKLRDYVGMYLSHYQVGEAWALELAATLSQIGRVSIPAVVLVKVRAGLSLTPVEKDMLTRVPRTGADLLAKIPRLESVAEIVLHQQKNYDGSGFPINSASGKEIPIGSRILKVMSDLLALESKGHSRVLGLAQMRACAGCYDPEVMDSVAACFDVCLPAVPGAESEWTSLNLPEVHPGMVFAANVETSDGTLIVPAETLVTPMLLERLRNFAQLKRLKQPVLIHSMNPASNPSSQ